MIGLRGSLAIGIAIACGGCMTAQTYDGPRMPRDEIAQIVGDMRLNAGAPIAVLLRQVDGVDLNIGQNSVEVLPGTHRLLVDCRIAATKDISRHTIEFDFYAGRRYRLVAETGPGVRECTGVRLEAD